MNMAFPTPRRSTRLLPSHFICEPGGSRKGKKWGLFNNEAAHPQSENGLNLESWLAGVPAPERASGETFTPPHGTSFIL